MFSVPVFLVVLRETIEAGVIVGILFAFLKQMRHNGALDVISYQRLIKQVSIRPGPDVKTPTNSPLRFGLGLSLGFYFAWLSEGLLSASSIASVGTSGIQPNSSIKAFFT